MLCHLGPEQTDHTININARRAEERHRVRAVPTPRRRSRAAPGPCPRSSPGSACRRRSRRTRRTASRSRTADFAIFDDPATPVGRPVDRAARAASPSRTRASTTSASGPITEDIGRGGNDAFGWPLSLAALALKNIGGPDFEPCDGLRRDRTVRDDELRSGQDLGADCSRRPGGAVYPGTTHTLQSINPGFEMDPIEPAVARVHGSLDQQPAGRRAAPADRRAGRSRPTRSRRHGGSRSSSREILFGPTSTAPTTTRPCSARDRPTSDGDPLMPEQPDRPSRRQLRRSRLNGTWPVPEPRDAERRVQGAASCATSS